MTAHLLPQKYLHDLDFSTFPEHVAIIPDGNRRWARQHFLPIPEGHRVGANNVMTIVETAEQLKVKSLTIYAFSTENWNRSAYEVQSLMTLLNLYLRNQRKKMVKNGVKFLTIGDLSRFSQKLLKCIEETKEATQHCNRIELILALNYGGRDEIRRAFTKMLEDYDKKKFLKEQLDEKMIESYLDTSQRNDPDLVIRTSGEQRASNFMPWQTAYSEVYTTSVLWPDFTPRHFLDAMLDYQKRDIRLGK